MNLYAAHISCKIRTQKKTAKVHKFEVQDFRYPITADSEQAAKLALEATFPWTFYKNVKVTWELIAENV